MMTGRGFVRLNRFVHAGEWKKRGSGAHDEARRASASASSGWAASARRSPTRVQRARACRSRTRAAASRTCPTAIVPDLKALAADSDFLVVASPGGAATKHIVNAEVLAALGKKGTLVNIARGSIVDEAALVAALQAGTIKARGPRRVRRRAAHSRRRCMTMDNVVLLPHVGSATSETRKAMGDLCKANLDAWFKTGKVVTLIPELRAEAQPVVRFRSGSAAGAGLPSPAAPHSTANSDAMTSASATNSATARPLAEEDHAGEHADDRHGQRRQRRDRHRQRPREREPRPVRERSGEEDVVEDREPRRRPTGAQDTTADAVSKNGAASASGSQPEQHHPAGQRVLRDRRLPLAQQHGADRPQDRRAQDEQCADRCRADVADVVAEQHDHPQHAEGEADDLAPVERLVQHGHRDQRRPDRHRVGDDRAAAGGQLLHAEEHEARSSPRC